MNRRDLPTTYGGAATATLENAAPASHKRLPFIETDDGAILFIRDWGKGEPVVFVHGWGLNSDMWRYQMTPFAAQGFRCVAYDRRSHGRSSDPGTGYDYDRLAADLAAVMDRLDLRDATLVAHSMGSGEVVRYLTRYGTERVARIALMAPSTPSGMKSPENPDGHDPAILDYLIGVWSQDFPQWLAENARPFFMPGTPQVTVDWGINMCLQTSLQALIECQRTCMRTDFRDELRRIQVPALVIHGDRDASENLELTGRRTAELIPGAKLIVYEGAPHGLTITHIERLNRDLQAFIRHR